LGDPSLRVDARYVFDAWNRNIAVLVNRSREDDLADIIPQTRFELQALLAIEQQITSQTRPIFAKALVSGIVPHGFEPVLMEKTLSR